MSETITLPPLREGTTITFKPAHENTGGKPDRDVQIYCAPDVVNEALKAGGEVEVKQAEKGIEWYINGQLVTDKTVRSES